jgi:hypothetical protein
MSDAHTPTPAQMLERAALRREGEAYLATGRLDRLELVNEQLRAVNEPEIAAPQAATRQTRQSATAATRKKRAT